MSSNRIALTPHDEDELEERMGDTEARLNAEFDAWFAKCCEIAKCKLDADDDPIWAELWFDGYTPQEAVDACNEEDD